MPGFSGLVEVPALKTLSALWISGRKRESRVFGFHIVDLLVRAESDDGFQLLYDTLDDDKVAWYWLGVMGVMDDADSSMPSVRFGGSSV